MARKIVLAALLLATVMVIAETAPANSFNVFDRNDRQQLWQQIRTTFRQSATDLRRNLRELRRMFTARLTSGWTRFTSGSGSQQGQQGQQSIVSSLAETLNLSNFISRMRNNPERSNDGPAAEERRKHRQFQGARLENDLGRQEAVVQRQPNKAYQQQHHLVSGQQQHQQHQQHNPQQRYHARKQHRTTEGSEDPALTQLVEQVDNDLLNRRKRAFA